MPHGCYIGWLDASIYHIEERGTRMGQKRHSHFWKGTNRKKVGAHGTVNGAHGLVMEAHKLEGHEWVY
jgi:hypothetical protein